LSDQLNLTDRPTRLGRIGFHDRGYRPIPANDHAARVGPATAPWLAGPRSTRQTVEHCAHVLARQRPEAHRPGAVQLLDEARLEAVIAKQPLGGLGIGVSRGSVVSATAADRGRRGRAGAGALAESAEPAGGQDGSVRAAAGPEHGREDRRRGKGEESRDEVCKAVEHDEHGGGTTQ
jgi:hypothetical protein